LLTALGGILARAPSDEAVAQLATALELTAGPERDALVDAIGLAPSASAMRVLGAVAQSSEPADRRAVAAMCASRKRDGQSEAGAVALVRALLGDADATVRAEAAWSLGTLGDDSDRARLEGLVRDPDFDTASNAVAAIGRISARVGAGGSEAAPSSVGAVLCPLLDRPRPYVRANALAGLALAGARCGDGARERAALTSDPAEDVRAAAALAVQSHAEAEDARALARCRRSDASGAVAGRCRSGALATTRTDATHPVLVYVVPQGADAPLPGASYAILLADGMVHSGTTDRRGAVFDPVAPEGEIALRRPSALAR
jgi:HEAT repeat protein